MVKYKEIIEVGKNLRKSDLKVVPTVKLYDILMEATKSHGRGTLIHYLKILKKEGYIKSTMNGWEIIRINRKLL